MWYLSHTPTILRHVAVDAPDLEERPFAASSSLYTSKYLLTGVQVFVAKCARCKVTYLPFVVDTEG